MFPQRQITFQSRPSAAPNLRALPAGLLLLALILTTQGCIPAEIPDWTGQYGSTGFAGQVKRPDEPPRPYLTSDTHEHVPGALADLNFGATAAAPPGSVLFYTPPAGATNFTFYGNQPDWYDPATNTYTFLNPNADGRVTYILGPSDHGIWYDSLRLDLPNGRQDSGFITWDISVQAHQVGAPTAAALPRAASAEDYWYWRTLQGFYAGVTMTQDLAHDVLTPWQGEGMLYALKVPVPTSPLTQSEPLPLVFHGNITPTLQLIAMVPGGGTLITAPIEYRLERMTFLEGTWPTGDGEMWAPLGLSADPLVYPSEPFTLTEWEWELALDLPLDLGGAAESQLKAAGLEPVVETYYCFENNQSASAMPLARALGGDLPTAFAQGGITCLGPQPLFLSSAPTLRLLPAMTAQVTPTQAISLHHYVQTSQPMTITLGISSTMNTPWTMYRQPNLADPIAPGAPIYVPGMFDFWIAGTIPTGAATGGYDLVITATPVDPPGSARWTRDILWVGEWAPPAQRRIYLPLVLR